jgi:hypothetical protein
MRIVLQALRAATIETLGVALVLCLLFGIPTWTLQQASGSASRATTVWTWLKSLPDELQSSVSQSGHQRREYTKEQLTHYGRMYGQAACGYAQTVAEELLTDAIPWRDGRNEHASRLLSDTM